MAEQERIRQYYNLTDEGSTEWTEPNTVSEIDLGTSNDTSKYALLRQLASTHTSGISDVPQDEADPLGSTNSIVSVLQSRGIDVSDPSKRNRYLISSTTFSPRLFLRDVHPEATYDNLVNSLNFLESTISERSEALRYLIEHDSDRFVQAKSSLDSVFKNIQAAAFNDPESELGFHHLKSLIDDSNAKATIMMKPVMDNRSKDERLNTALALVDGNKYLFNLPSLILTHIKNNDHDSLVRDYRRGKDMRSSEEEILSSSDDLTTKIEKQRVLERIWNEVEKIVDEYKKQIWKKLAETSAEQNYLGIITKQLELGVEDNPITEWISAQAGFFETKFTEAFDKLESSTEHYRNNILLIPQNPAVLLLNAIKVMTDVIDSSSGSNTSSATASVNKETIIYDSPDVLEMWITIQIVFSEINDLISHFCVFWKKAQEFMEGIHQQNLPTGWQNESQSHLYFTNDEVEHIKKSSQRIINIVSVRTEKFFSDRAVIDDALKRDVPDHQPVAPTDQILFKFTPPFCNALSAVKYLTNILFLVGTGLSNLSVAVQSPQTTTTLRAVLTTAREKAVDVITTAWEQDAVIFHLVEDWAHIFERHSTRTPEYFYAYQSTVISGVENVLKMANDQGQLIEGDIIPPLSPALLKQIQSCFFNSVSTTLDSIMKMALPSDKTESKRRSLAASMKKSASTPEQTEAKPPSKETEVPNLHELLPDSMNEEKKTLLILLSLEQIRDTKLPSLFKIMEKALRVNSREASAALKGSIDTMANTLFELYNRRKKTLLAEGLRHGILNPASPWNSKSTINPSAISSYIYECLLNFVVIHSRVSEISPGQVSKVITVLYDHVVKTMLACYREVEQFDRYGLLQVIADIGLMRVTMERFQTPDMLSNYSLMYDCIKEATINRKALWESATPPWEIIHPLVLQAQTSSKAEFRCFSSNK